MLCVLYASGVAVSPSALLLRRVGHWRREVISLVPQCIPSSLSQVSKYSFESLHVHWFQINKSRSIYPIPRIFVRSLAWSNTSQICSCLFCTVCMIDLPQFICFRLIYVEVFLLAVDRIRDQQLVDCFLVDGSFLCGEPEPSVSIFVLFQVEAYQFSDCVVIL